MYITQMIPLCHIDYGDISPIILVDAAKRLQAGQHVKAVARLKQKEGCRVHRKCELDKQDWVWVCAIGTTGSDNKS